MGDGEVPSGSTNNTKKSITYKKMRLIDAFFSTKSSQVVV